MNNRLWNGASALASLWIQACCGWGWACVGYGVCLNGVELVMQFVAKGVCHVLLLKGPSMTDGVPNGGSRKVCGRNSRTEESQFGPISR